MPNSKKEKIRHLRVGCIKCDLEVNEILAVSGGGKKWIETGGD